MPGVAIGPLDLTGVPLLEKGPGLGPGILKGFFQKVPFHRPAVRFGDFGKAGVGPVEVVEPGGSLGKHGASLEDLDPDPHLEHVGGRGHGHVGLTGFGEHLPDRGRSPGLDAGLVDGSGEDKRGAHGKGRGGGGGGGDPSGQSHGGAIDVAVLIPEVVPKGHEGGQEGQGRAVVGMAAGIGLGGQVRRDGDLTSQRRRIRRYRAGPEKLR